jgi:tetratricopeptide (TPR) repeat protein
MNLRQILEQAKKDSTGLSLDELLSLSSKIIQRRPKEADGYIARGDVLIDLDRYDEAVVDLTKAIELNPESAVAYAHRGRAFLELGKLNEAIVDITTAAIKLYPSAEAYVQRAGALEQLGRHKDAFNDLKEAVELGLSSSTGNGRLDRAMGFETTTKPKAQY